MIGYRQEVSPIYEMKEGSEEEDLDMISSSTTNAAHLVAQNPNKSEPQ